MTAPTIATDVAVLDDLLALRGAGLPDWSCIHVNVCTRVIAFRVAAPTDIATWQAALGSADVIGAEPVASSAVVFHRVDISGWHPGWKVSVTAVTDMFPGLLPALLDERFGTPDAH